MLDNDDGIAQITQPAKGSQQLVIITLVKSYGRFIQDIRHADQAGTDLGSQPDPLGFSSRERSGRAGKC